jgi:hypothetical protein
MDMNSYEVTSYPLIIFILNIRCLKTNWYTDEFAEVKQIIL